MTTMPYNYSYNNSTALSASLNASVKRSQWLRQAYEKNTTALGTGKDVNTPYDDPIRYFKDAHLSEKAQSITDLLDNISIITSTLNSVDDSLTTLNDLVDMAKGAATKARQTLDTPAIITGNVKLLKERAMSEIGGCKGGDVLCLRYGEANRAESSQTVSKLDKLSDFGITLGENFSVKVGDDDWVDIPVTNQDMTLDAFMKEVVLTLGEDRVKYTIKDNKLTLETTDQTGIIFSNRHYDKSTKELIATDTSPSVAEKLGFDQQVYLTVDDDDTVESLMLEINKIDGFEAKLDKNNHLQISSQYGDDIIVTDFSGTTAKATGIDGMARDGLHVRRDEAKNYNDILDQIDELVKDSIFNGVNLLAGDDMRAVFGEKAQSIREIYGVNLDAESMGLAREQNDWASTQDIDSALTSLESAINQIRSAAQYFDRSNAMVSSRETFLNALSATFQKGADAMTLADLNEVSSQLLSIKTQQDIAAQVISLTLEIDSDILSLF